MSLLPVGISGEEAGYQIERSLRFNSPDSAYLSRTPGSAGNRKTWTWSGWVKRSALSATEVLLDAGTGPNTFFRFDANQKLAFSDYTSGPTYNIELISTQVLRDVSAWYHIVVAVDTTQATSTNRVKIYLNGSQITAFSTATYPSQNFDTGWNNATAHRIGSYLNNTSYLNGYLTEINFIDGQALTPSSFGETDTVTGVWKPKKYTGTYSGNSFYLNFSDNSGTTSTTLGKDSSGLGNNWTPNNFSVTAGAGNDSLVDTPTPYGTDTGVGGEVRGNYATLNAVRPSTATLSEGNLKLTATTAAAWANRLSTIGMREGKWYCEFTIDLANSPFFIGIADEGTLPTQYIGQSAGSWGYYGSGGTVWNNASSSALGASYTTGDLIGIAFNADSGQLTFYKNGVSQGTVSSIPSGQYFFAFSGTSVSTAGTANFGQRPFAYTAPSGFKALCTQNLPEPTIVDGGQYFNTVLYTGTGSNRSVTGVGFQPDWVWVKDRTVANSPQLSDSVRGFASDKGLQTTNTLAEGVNSQLYGYISAALSDGFSVAAGTDPSNGSAAVNASGDNYVAWNWKANGSGVSNTDGTITSTVSVNTTSGFSIVTYTGNSTANSTVGHGLGVAPGMVIIKNRSAVQNWPVAHSSLAANNLLLLDTTNSTISSGTRLVIGNSTTFTVGDAADYGITNQSGQNYVAYCFAPVSGYSAFSSYTGNGSADGPFVYTGFRPAFVMIKRTDGAGSWSMYDAKRNPFNQVGQSLFANVSNAEYTNLSGYIHDFLSNGFKPRQSTGDNNSGATYIYMAFAENPFKYSLAR